MPISLFVIGLPVLLPGLGWGWSYLAGSMSPDFAGRAGTAAVVWGDPAVLPNEEKAQ